MDTSSPESLLTSGQESTAAAGEQTAVADNTATETQANIETKPEGSDAATDTKDAEGKPAEGAKDGEKPAGAPETYDAFTMPEGFALDEQLLGEFTPVLKDLNLPQEAAQKLIDFAPKLVEKTVAQTTASVLDQLGLADHATWAEQVKADKEIGGEKFAENLGIAQKAASTFFTPAALDALKRVGLGNHPELIRGFLKVGKAISEDGFVPGGKTTTVKNPAMALYDASTMNP